MIGQRLGPYTIEAELGSGGMGRVFRAVGPAGPVALKVLHPHLLESPGFFKRFLREAEIGKKVDHPNVVRTLDVDAISIAGTQFNYLVMEYVEGQTLRDLMAELGRMPEELCRHIGREVAEGLNAIHAADIVHRDLKPENVLITRDHVVKVMDLGVAWLADEAMKLSHSGSFVGSVMYAAPEQFTNEEPDGRADYYALGLMLYELATAHHPSRADDFLSVMRMRTDETPRPAGQVNPQLTAYFEELLNCLLTKDRGARLGSFPEEDSDWWRERAKLIRAQTRRPRRRIRIPRETALYGRDAELKMLGGLFEKAKRGDGQVALIEGEAGIGKSRLVDEFVGRLGGDVHFLFGSYPSGGAATAAGAFSTAYREQFGEEGCTHYLTDTPLLVAAFDALLRGDAPPEGKEPLTKHSLQAVFVQATRALAEERPTIVLIDDLHFAPEDGRGLFAALSLALPGHRVLLIGTTRPDLPAAWTASVERQEHATRMSLPRLGPKDLAALLEESFGSRSLAEKLGFQIITKSDGNPFFAFEIIRALREGRFITQTDDGAWVSTRVIEKIQIPSSVRELIQARITDLREEERDLLDVAACAGFEFDPLLVGEVLDLERIPLLKRLAQIERRHRLVRSSGTVYVFDHHQVQEALYEGVPELLRREYHLALADAIRRRSGRVQEADAVSLCEHFLSGARGEHGLPHLQTALEHLSQGYLHDAAIALADRALAVKGLLGGRARLEILMRRDQELNLVGRLDEQRLGLDEALVLANQLDEPGPASEVHLAVGRNLFGAGRYDEASRSIAQALALARQAGERTSEALATRNLGNVAIGLGRYEEAETHYRKALAMARELEDVDAEAAATINLGLVFWSQGRYEEAGEQTERGLVLAREARNRVWEFNAETNLGTICIDTGRHEEARERFERCLERTREIGYRLGEVVSLGNLGLALSGLGRYEEAQRYYARSLAIAREIGDPGGETRAQGNLGLATSNLGDFGAALACYRAQLDLAHRTGDRAAIARATGNLGLVFTELGASEEARENLERYLVLSREVGDRRQEVWALEYLARLSAQAGDASDARLRYGEALDLAREIGQRETVATSLIGLGRTEAADGLAAEAVARFEEAARIGRELNTPGTILVVAAERAGTDPAGALQALEDHETLAWRTARMRARFLIFKATGDSEHLEEARRHLEHLRDRAPAEYRESLLANVPLHREIRRAWQEHRVGTGDP